VFHVPSAASKRFVAPPLTAIVVVKCPRAAERLSALASEYSVAAPDDPSWNSTSQSSPLSQKYPYKLYSPASGSVKVVTSRLAGTSAPLAVQIPEGDPLAIEPVRKLHNPSAAGVPDPVDPTLAPVSGGNTIEALARITSLVTTSVFPT